MFFAQRRFLTDTKKLAQGMLPLEAFLKKYAHHTLYYSTPFGEDVSGKQQLWVLSSRENALRYMPAFTKKDRCRAFLTMLGRRDFLIIKGNLSAFLGGLDAHQLLSDLGAVIDPDTVYPVEIPPKVRV